MPVSEWDADFTKREVLPSLEAGLNAMAAVLVESVKAKLGERGATFKMLKEGRRAIRKAEKKGFFSLYSAKNSGRRNRAIAAAMEEQKFGKVDKIGGYPRLRTGNLRRSADFQKTGELHREAGYLPTGAAHVYGTVHEFGNATTPPRPVWTPSFKNEQVSMFEAFVKQSRITYESGAQPPESAS